MNDKVTTVKSSELQPASQENLPAVAESPASQVLNSLTRSIETGDLQPEQLSAILDAQERVLDRQAKQDFAIAMAKCQSEMPQILKSETNDQTRSKFESLDGLNKAISPVYTRNGFSISFGTDDCPMNNSETNDGLWLRITADVSHCGGWIKAYHYDLPYDMAGIKGSVNKTKIHASGSTLTYGRRYLLKLIFNLTTVDELDDDGNGADVIERISESPIADLESLIDEVGADGAQFLKVCKVEKWKFLPADKLAGAINMLEKKRDQK